MRASVASLLLQRLRAARASRAGAATARALRWARVSLVGAAGGAFGAAAGLGGGVVVVPLLASRVGGSLRQHAAHGTSLVGVLATGSVGAAVFYLAGERQQSQSVPAGEHGGAAAAGAAVAAAEEGSGRVDVRAAALLAVSAMTSARFGARWVNTVSPARLRVMLGTFMIATTPLVAYKKRLAARFGARHEHEHGGGGGGGGGTAARGGILHTWPVLGVPALAGIGLVTGFLSGVFGVGGGMVMVPLLGLLTSHQAALGTSLLAMLGPAAVGSYTHFMLGNVHVPFLAPLLLGSATGALLGARRTASLSEAQQRRLYATVVLLLGAKTLLL